MAAVSFLRRSMQALSVCLSLTLMTQVHAQVAEETFAGRSEISGDDRHEKGAIVNFRWKAAIRFGLLQGEPVISVHFKWDDPRGAVTIPTLTPTGREYQNIRTAQLPDELLDKIRLLDVKLRIEVGGENCPQHFPVPRLYN